MGDFISCPVNSHCGSEVSKQLGRFADRYTRAANASARSNRRGVIVGDVVAACNFEKSEIQRGVARRFWVTREKSAIQPCGMQATNPLDSDLHCPPPQSRAFPDSSDRNLRSLIDHPFDTTAGVFALARLALYF